MSKLLDQLQGLGMDELDAGASMPLIKILQKSAAEVDETHADYTSKKVEGAKAGDIYFMGEGKLLEKPVEFLPLSQKTLYAEWRPKGSGGGLVAHHNLTIQGTERYRRGTEDKRNKEFLGENELVMTIYFMILFHDGDEWKRAILSFQSSNLKHGRALAKMIRGFSYPDLEKKPFIFSRSFNLDTTLCRGQGNSWHEFNIEANRVLDFKDDQRLLMDAMEAHTDAVKSLPNSTQETKRLESEDEPF